MELTLEEKVDELTARVQHIERLLLKIQWTATGAASLIVLSTMGFADFLKTLL